MEVVFKKDLAQELEVGVGCYTPDKYCFNCLHKWKIKKLEIRYCKVCKTVHCKFCYCRCRRK